MNAGWRDTNSYSTYVGPYWNHPDGLATWKDDDLSWAVSQATIKLYEDIRGNTDLSVDAFQVKKTLSIKKDIRNVLRQTYRLARALAKRKLDFLTIPGNIWLQYVYGIKPSLQSLHDAISHTTVHYVGTSKMFKGRVQVPRTVDVFIPSYLDGSWAARTTLQTSARCLIKCRMVIPDNTVTEAARLTSLNPASIAWELMPFSFVVDWFLNVGSYLRDTESRLIFNQYFKSGFQTTSWKEEGNLTGGRIDPRGFGYHSCWKVDKSTSRTVLYSLPPVQLPNFRVNLGAGRLLNAAALLTTFLRH